MSDPVPLVWLPASLCEDVSQALQALFATYCNLWGLPAPLSVRVSRQACSPAPACTDDAPLDLAKAWPERLRSAVTQALFQRPYAESAILGGVLDRLEQSLQLALAEKFAGGGATRAANDAPRPGHAGLACDIEWLQCHLQLSLSCEQLRGKGWLRQAARQPSLAHVDMERALVNAQVPLLARIGSVTVNVGDVLHLAPGDVLLLSETLDEPLRVSSPGSSLTLRALLGSTIPPVGPAAAPRRAMRCLPLQAS